MPWRISSKRFLKAALIAHLAIAALLIGRPALAQDIPGDVVEGRVLVTKACKECHSLSLEQRLLRPYDAPGFDEIAEKPQTTAISLRAFLQQPHPSMPDLILTQEERDNAIAYILSLKRQSH